MRVLHVIPSLAARYGGPSAVIGPMIEALRVRPDLEIEIATTDADGAGGRSDPRAGDSAAVPLHVFRRNCSEQWKISVGFWGWMRKNTLRFDLVHIHSIWNFPTAAACAAARASNRPYIIRPCGMLSQYTWQRAAVKKRLYWAAVEHRNLVNASGVHVTSEGESSDVVALKLAAEPNVFTIPLGLDPAAWRVERQPARLRNLLHDRAGDRPILLFLSRLHPKKGIVDVLLPAMARLKSDAVLAIVGGSDERTPRHDAEIRREAQRLGIAERVFLLGPVAPPERWSMFDGATVFVLPSHSENFGVVVAEAMARGVPVVVTDAVQSCTHVRAAGAGKVVPVDADAVAAGLDVLLSDPAACRRAGAAGRQYVREYLGWESIAGRIGAMYESCMR
jgi:glycosyltransferase involved in cell wall biosynthesis